MESRLDEHTTYFKITDLDHKKRNLNDRIASRIIPELFIRTDPINRIGFGAVSGNKIYLS